MRGKGGQENASCTYKGVWKQTWGKWVAEYANPIVVSTSGWELSTPLTRQPLLTVLQHVSLAGIKVGCKQQIPFQQNSFLNYASSSSSNDLPQYHGNEGLVFKTKPEVTATGYPHGYNNSGVTSVMSNNNNVVDDNGNKVVKSEEGNMEEVWNILNINLPETDDSVGEIG
ncbi:dehydration-responsive element-binding protein 2B-like [Coffea arabica]|uniref:Dehydration-responsive element-binding protein 2B-like n=1 Tax=Coffea arabica TaxID=13443 RepID=A0ABM4UFQ4_COFAR